MSRSLLKEISFYSLGSWVGRGFSILTVPIYTRILGPADYGALDLLNNIATILPLMVGLALDQAVARFFIESSDEQQRRSIVTTVLVYNLAVFALLLLPAAFLASEPLANHWLDGQVSEDTVFLVFVLAGVNLCFTNAVNLLRYTFRSGQFSSIQVATVVLSGVSCIGFVVWGRLGVYGIFLGQAISQGVFTLVALYLCRKNFGCRVDGRVFRTLVGYSFPLMPSTLIFYVMQYVDRYVINSHLGLEQVGVYGIGARVAGLVDLFLSGFHGAWWPEVMKSHAEPGAPERFKQVFCYYVFGTASLIIGISLFGQELLALLASAEFRGSYRVVPLLVSAVILGSINNYFSYGIQLGKKSFRRLGINVVGVAINAGLSLLLVPEYGALGAAAATFASFLLMAAAAMTVSQRLYRVPYPWFRIVAAYGLAVLTAHLVVVHPLPITLESVAVKGGAALLTILLLAGLLRIRPAATLRMALQRGGAPA